MNDSKGNVICIKNAICMHEEDHGILWKHTNWRSGECETRRSRRLVVSMFATVCNYEYGYYWYFYLDGSMEFEAKLTGVINVGAALDNETPKNGAMIAPNLFAPIHQHFFCIRMDLALDGVNNSVYEVNVLPEKEGAHNPQNSGYYPDYRLLKTDSDAAGQVDARQHRFWKIINSSSLNPHTGQPVSYRLDTHGNAFPYAGSNASVIKRAGFMKNHVWITQYDPEQLYAAGKYPNQHPGGDGLEKWTKGNKSIVDNDLVLWYTLGILHFPRCEDFPVMPVASARFSIKPDGFFTMNPANDVPPSCTSGKD
jgi:primary-amine oxidase